MRYNTHTYINATFRSTPSPFTQCRIITVYDVGTELNVPYFFYMNSFFSMELNRMPKYITMDFELGMIRAINHEFPESRIIGCYYHFKQTINKLLPKFKISNQDRKTIMDKI
ncbi:hypothetical protein HZS_5497 [Henneguya salminicola]|nr:hypothetical protein HZS_5497 [Henneguya salminicola]